MKTRHWICLLLFSFALISTTNAQEFRSSANKNEWHIGLGLGIPYGRRGVKLNYNPVNQFGVFIGVGSWVTAILPSESAGIAYNLGATYTIETKKRTEVYFLGSYGINSAIDEIEFDEVFQGVSIGTGVKINSRKKKENFWDLGFVIPFKGEKYNDALTKVKGNYIEYHFTLTIAYNFGFKTGD